MRAVSPYPGSQIYLDVHLSGGPAEISGIASVSINMDGARVKPTNFNRFTLPWEETVLMLDIILLLVSLENLSAKTAYVVKGLN